MDAPSSVVRQLRPVTPLPFVAWLGLLFWQVVSPDPAWSWFLVGLGMLIIVSYVWARTLRDRVSATRRTLGTWVVVGDQLHEEFTLTNAGWLPALWMEVHDRSGVPGYQVDRVETADGHAERVWRTLGVCQRRGAFRLGPWALEMSDPLGFFKVTHEYQHTTSILVYPRAAFLPNLNLPRGRSPGRSMAPDRAVEETLLVGGVRAYLPGDPLRRIHWRATARHEELIVREFDREPTGDLWLAVDLDASVQAGQGAESTLEYAITLAASLAAQYLRQGERRGVGLLMAGTRPALLPPSRSPEQMWRILEALALAEAGEGVSFEKLLRHQGPILGSGRTLILITPSQDPSWIAPLLPLVTRGNAPTAWLIDASTFDPPAGKPGGLAGIIALLAQQRLLSTVIERGFPFRPVERIRRQRTDLKALSATGRVVRVQVEEEV